MVKSLSLYHHKLTNEGILVLIRIPIGVLIRDEIMRNKWQAQRSPLSHWFSGIARIMLKPARGLECVTLVAPKRPC